jgi:hypothetical protein
VLSALDDRWLGSLMLAFLAFGLVGYTLWRLIQAVLDPGHHHDLSWQRIAQRCGYLFSGLTYLGVAYTAARLALGLVVDFDDTVEDFASVLLTLSAGPWVLLGVSAGTLLVGGIYIYGAISKGFISNFQAQLYSPVKRWTVIVGQIGFIARGGSFILIGLFLAKAAYQIDAEPAGGLDAALSELGDYAWGHIGLWAIAIGFLAYATYMTVSAFYRTFPSPHPNPRSR